MRSTTLVGAVTAAVLLVAACGDEETSGDTTIPTTAVSKSTVAATTVPDSTVAKPTVPPTTANDEAWRKMVDEVCARGVGVVTIPPPTADQASLDAYVQAHLDFFESAPDFSSIGIPPGPGRTTADLVESRTAQQDAIDNAVAAAAAGDHAAAIAAINAFRGHLAMTASAFAASGTTCGPADADVAADAALNVSMYNGWQLETGFGDVWVSQDLADVDQVARIDPDTGEVVAAIPMPSLPVKLQPADGRMIVRTADSYVAIDAATNTVVGTLPRADVGPNADRSWAVDGALWICDGQRLHRYDPTTFTAVAVLELDHGCNQVYATADVAVAWTYNGDPGESGDSRATFVDTRTNTVLATLQLAADAGVPIVLDDVVFFPPALGSRATVVDRTTWTVTKTPEYGRFIDSGSQPAFDGAAIYVIADKASGTIVAIDPTTLEITGEIRALATGSSQPNSLAASPGVLWAANNGSGVLQRFDTAG